MPQPWYTLADLRDRLLLVSARDQGDDTRDELIALRCLGDRAMLLRHTR